MTHLGHRLSALIDGELDAVERDRVLVHLAGCEPCRDEAVALRTLKRRMNALGEAAADAGLTRRLIGLAHPGGATSPGQAGPRPWPASEPLGSERGGREARPAWYVTIGATAVVLVGVGTAAFLAGGGTGQPGPSGPQITPAVDTYLFQRDILNGISPGTLPTPSRHGRHTSKSLPSPAP
ncbi:MAG TPA: anti-sigma factor [Streptosporangiaceae bacterium]|nr:anti-sigma factor [Streptosporangiaceae bacterium]